MSYLAAPCVVAAYTKVYSLTAFLISSGLASSFKKPASISSILPLTLFSLLFCFKSAALAFWAISIISLRGFSMENSARTLYFPRSEICKALSPLRNGMESPFFHATASPRTEASRGKSESRSKSSRIRALWLPSSSNDSFVLLIARIAVILSLFSSSKTSSACKERRRESASSTMSGGIMSLDIFSIFLRISAARLFDGLTE